MPFQWNVPYKGFKNVVQNGKITGFQVGVQIGYYRGIFLSLIEGFEVTIDGETFRRDQTKATIGGRTYTLDEMETIYDVMWPWQEFAILTISKRPGMHDVQVTVKNRVSYMPNPHRVATFRARMPLVM
jgi:hypothetical protein